MSVEEIDKVIRETFVYDEYEYQKNNIIITEKYRVEGLHKVLYQCPHWLKESKMNSSEEYGKRWNFNEDGTLSALSGETEFSHVPDWFEWQRANVIQEVEEGRYSFEDDVDAHSLPRTSKVMHLGSAKVVHDKKNLIFKGFYKKQEYRIIREPLMANSLHVEYDYCHIKPYDCFDITTKDDCYFCYPKKQNVITNLGFATEAIYQYNFKKINNK